MSKKTGRNSKTDVDRAAKRAAQNIRKHKQSMSSYLSEDVNYGGFSNHLALLGLKLRDIPGDGNCLFRALGDQMDGHSDNHLRHREEIVKYMTEHRSDFEPFVEDDIPFNRHVENLRNPGTYAGNDAIVAFARKYNVNVVIHQLNAPIWTVKGNEQPNSRQLHIAYHNGDHYSSIRKINDNSNGPANVKLGEYKETENLMQRKNVKKRSDSVSEYELQKIKRIIEVTGCQDRKLIRKILNETGQDEDETVGLILQSYLSEDDESPMSSPNQEKNDNINHRTSNNSIWDKDGSGTRIFGGHHCATSNTGKPKKNINVNTPPKKLTNRQRQDQARRDKNKRKSARRKNTPTSDSDESEIMVKNLSMLNI
ncbi:OTU domain-containing protein 3-like [Styela clava]|uniref:OTU domain-containing protein 3-like n=1 Tax=Styela clava TaxID=7725 RepID=UPI00193AB8AE|nr:OTU domain-containing protein 3-like [Styela clava]